jgi:hypothetical protein
MKESDPLKALYSYITDFMRPQGPNWEYRRSWQEDINRGTGFLRQHQALATPRPKVASSAGGMTIHQTNTYNIRATDPKGTAREIAALQRRHAVAQADRGVVS